ncbi:FRG domain-containing protein [Kangiella profundi]|nr:FRG domain-containing protein [Kangiella profundi]GGF03396.1 hypothetical protein GCM10011356_16390 [Kangiella profundi]
MIEETTIRSWNSLMKKFEEISMHGDMYNGFSVLFRGEGDKKWGIRSTLERRAGAKTFDLVNYYNRINHFIDELNSFKNEKWELPRGGIEEIRREVLSENTRSSNLELLWLELLIYLRHHGFPSPLIDWSMSPIVALYFCLKDMKGECDGAVYCFQENFRESNGRGVSSPITNVIGPYITTHRRHFLQQANYTVSGVKNYYGEGLALESVTLMNFMDCLRDESNRHKVTKIIIKNKFRKEFLRRIMDFNINDYVLFNSEDSLIETFACKSFDI